MGSWFSSHLRGIGAFKEKIPARLSFEEIIRDNTRSPCSLDEFRDYLIYVERNAENLQFYLWYCDYVERWSQLSEQEKARSSSWETKRGAHLRQLSWSAALGERTEKLNRILKILDQITTTGTQHIASFKELDSEISRVETNFSRPRTPASKLGIKESQKELQWQPFSAQPFRDEVTQITRHYISISGLRKLTLTSKDRTACMHALQHTTHPSAFLPAFLATELILREHSHPNFIQWSIHNSNRPRVLFARAVGTLLIVLAILLDIAFILSSLNRLVRLSALPFWYGGLYFWLIEGRGISVGLYMNRKRQLRPWERVMDVDLENNHSEMDPGQAQPHGPSDSPDNKIQKIITENSSKTESLKGLGPANNFDGESWVRLYREKPMRHKIFDTTVLNHNRHLRALQDRIVFTSLLWASFLMIVLTVGSVLIPSADLF
ncbi:uncharacterized protein F4822DRAFT_429538 [Hypoxylon trugodes]|uniref:uncharacterized protein n=1 Tax=Hypoxylon trugodes TaxID=326681 RepID=UPI0021973669|nr:uncharacterized protein F4822DRAFT_429538 [Hypoxylon trugodes]KAI1388922.1 hypothetical protein F4822DRAFT_429538 [Hypoxylon trugodes]